jgi:hypothetical protein
MNNNSKVVSGSTASTWRSCRHSRSWCHKRACYHCRTMLCRRGVAEPPELYGPHVPTIVFQTSDTAHASQTTLVVCRVFSENPESSTFYNSYRINKGVVTTLQHLIQK